MKGEEDPSLLITEGAGFAEAEGAGFAETQGEGFAEAKGNQSGKGKRILFLAANWLVLMKIPLRASGGKESSILFSLLLPFIVNASPLK